MSEGWFVHVEALEHTDMEVRLPSPQAESKRSLLLLVKTTNGTWLMGFSCRLPAFDGIPGTENLGTVVFGSSNDDIVLD